MLINIDLNKKNEKKVNGRQPFFDYRRLCNRECFKVNR